jgi:hypothetical protein
VQEKHIVGRVHSNIKAGRTVFFEGDRVTIV